MKTFAHFLITRFNLDLYPRDKKDRPTRTEAWLRHRFELFERWCLPSVRAQTCPDFTWLVLFDRDTPEEYKARIAACEEQCPRMQAVYYDREQALRLNESLRATLFERMGKDRPRYLLTTNLDNDDALSAEAIGLLQQAAAAPEGKTLYSLLYGYQYFTKTGLLLKMRYTNNHFLTVAEPTDGLPDTVVHYRHTKAIRLLPTVYVRTRKGMWLEFVHEDNVSNDFRINARIRNIPVLRGRDLGDFGLDLKVSAPGQIVRTLGLLPVTFLYTSVKRLLSKRRRRRREKNAR